MFEANPVKRVLAEMPTQLLILNTPHLTDYANFEYVDKEEEAALGVEGRKSDTSDGTLASHGGPGNACHLRLTSNCLNDFHCEEEFCRTLKLPSLLSCGITALSIGKRL